MLLKLLGGAFILLSSSSLGFYYSYKDSFRINDLLELKKAFIILNSEISYSLSSLPDAFKNISERTNEPVNKIFNDLSSRLCQKDGKGIYEIWCEILDKHKSKTFYNNEDIDTLCAFGKVLGYLDRSMQINNIKSVIDYIDEKCSEIRMTNLKNKKMYQSLGVLSGLILILILV